MIEEVPIVDSEEGAAVVLEPVAKKRGRPKGAPNKPKAPKAPDPAPKPAPKPTPPSESEEEPVPVKAKKKRVKAPPSSSDEEPPTPKPRRSRARTISPVMDTRQVASEVLQLLSNRQVTQAAARREKYRSWFPAT